MCGRYRLAKSGVVMAQHVCLKNTPAIKLRYNIAPGQMALIIVQSETGEREGVMKKWGLIASSQNEKVA